MLPFRIQVVSDIHLEFRETFNIEPKAENLALCGDIGYPKHARYLNFLADVSTKFKRIFLIAGNHEYYSCHVEKTQRKIREAVKNFQNIYFLDGEAILLEWEGKPFQVFGATMWTMIMNERYLIATQMNDYQKIRINEMNRYRKIIPADVNSWHIKSYKALTKALSLNIPTIVLTHHLPSFKCIHPHFQNRPLNEAYAAHLDDLIKPPILAWFFGHTHNFTNLEINNIKVGANPVGYPNEYGTDYQVRVWSGFIDDFSSWKLE